MRSKVKLTAAAMVPFLAGCSGPLSVLSPRGPAAADIAMLWWGMLGGAGAITLLVLALIWRSFAPRSGPAPSEGFWVKGMGLGFSGAILAALVAAGIWIGERIQPHPGENVVRVEAIAQQWRWRFRQPMPGEMAHAGEMIETQARLYIPAATPIDVVIRSQDVIHAFWVPQLAGKRDAIPGRDTVLRIMADQPGVYHGQSAEFSGPGYARMRFEVLAYDPSQAEALAQQLKGNMP